MNCPQQSEQDYGLLLDYTAGRLTGERKAMVEAHMATCRECASFQNEQAALWSALDEWEPPPVSRDFDHRLWQHIRGSATAPWRSKWRNAPRFGAWKPAFPLAAAAALLIAGFLLDHRAKEVPKPAAPAVSSAEAEQVESTLDDLQLLKQLDAGSARPM